MAEVEENVKLNSKETVESSSGEEVNGDFNSGGNDETVKTFKDLVGLPEVKQETSFWHYKRAPA